MRLFWSAAGELHAFRAWVLRRSAIRRYTKSRDVKAATVRYLASAERYAEIKKTSEKFFKRAGRAV